MTISTTSTQTFFTNSAQQLASLQSQANDVQTSISTGSKFSTASQDPLAASQMRMLSLQDNAATVDAASASKATTDLKLADSAMTQMVNDIARAQQLATQAANGALSDTERASIGNELAQIHTDLVGLANSRDSDGNALFGGGAQGKAYTLDASGNATYAGNAQAQSLSIGGGQSVQRSVTGPEMLSFKDSSGNTTDLLTVVKSLADTLKAGGTGSQAAANGALTSLSTALDTMSTAQTVVGSRESWIALNTQNQTAMNEARAKTESTVGDTDVSAAAIKLQQLTTALQASQASFMRLSSLSLFDVLK
ncbi:flagellar hook-associated protein FlgL [Novosphingobium nitrogenifigens DSM 19370]|uniref:Flagellar hook-associated protein FlgL n=1 Tax=Novosphingobium nitrogenifigens DSM 19370 TaxID=983920 RepID=F1Z7M9_9SPHN|nr:flagellar hook-associated protein FlgL [Novosphingobium nitrogenifigens]EGD59420.1 flagellar hook-associated protein FlgL [Novosphingobium nitrogenifigens DSM 19370]